MVLNAIECYSYEEVKHCPRDVYVPVFAGYFVRKSLASWVKCRETVTIGSMFSFVVGICEFN